jgi:hypothetical protein
LKINNIHERVLNASADRVGELIDGLASADDRLWPHDRWLPMRFDRPLEVGASGGHGPIRYVVESYSPGRRVQFRFIEPKGFAGVHFFEVVPLEAEKTMLRHTIEMEAAGIAWLAWSIAIRPLHDALLEDALDRAEAFTGRQPPKRKLSGRVIILRWIMRPRRSARPVNGAL